MTPAFVSGGIGPVICRALGLDPKQIKDIHLHFEAGNIAGATITRFISDADGQKIAIALGEYELQLRDDATPRPVAPDPQLPETADVTGLDTRYVERVLMQRVRRDAVAAAWRSG